MGVPAVGRKVKAFWKAQAIERATADAHMVAREGREAAYRALTGGELGAITRLQNPYEATVKVKVGSKPV